jgi:hypothetical protein
LVVGDLSVPMLLLVFSELYEPYLKELPLAIVALLETCELYFRSKSFFTITEVYPLSIEELRALFSCNSFCTISFLSLSK